MEDREYHDIDKLLRFFYKRQKKMIPWNEVYKSVEMSKDYADELYNILEADGYIETVGKGGGIDGHYVTITKEGISFFSKTNYVNEYLTPKEAKSSSKVMSWILNHMMQLIISILTAIIVFFLGFG